MPRRKILERIRGKEIPLHLMEIFDVRQRAMEMMLDLSRINVRLAEQSRQIGGQAIEMAAVNRGFEMIRNALLQGLPTDLCECKGPICHRCGGKGWVTGTESLQ
ncbi:MAG: hypothetical protein ACOY3P_20115 [Planctomycetota bacterium]